MDWKENQFYRNSLSYSNGKKWREISTWYGDSGIIVGLPMRAKTFSLRGCDSTGGQAQLSVRLEGLVRWSCTKHRGIQAVSRLLAMTPPLNILDERIFTSSTLSLSVQFLLSSRTILSLLPLMFRRQNAYDTFLPDCVSIKELHFVN